MAVNYNKILVCIDSVETTRRSNTAFTRTIQPVY